MSLQWLPVTASPCFDATLVRILNFVPACISIVCIVHCSSIPINQSIKNVQLLPFASSAILAIQFSIYRNNINRFFFLEVWVQMVYQWFKAVYSLKMKWASPITPKPRHFCNVPASPLNGAAARSQLRCGRRTKIIDTLPLNPVKNRWAVPWSSRAFVFGLCLISRPFSVNICVAPLISLWTAQ